VSPARDRRAPYRFRVSGGLVPPDFITLGRACRGGATLTARSGRRTVRLRKLRIEPTCRVAATVTMRRPQRLVFRLRFRGNAALAGGSRHVPARAG
jgi:hypothetical protein